MEVLSGTLCFGDSSRSKLHNIESIIRLKGKPARCHRWQLLGMSKALPESARRLDLGIPGQYGISTEHCMRIARMGMIVGGARTGCRMHARMHRRTGVGQPAAALAVPSAAWPALQAATPRHAPACPSCPAQDDVVVGADKVGAHWPPQPRGVSAACKHVGRACMRGWVRWARLGIGYIHSSPPFTGTVCVGRCALHFTSRAPL